MYRLTAAELNEMLHIRQEPCVSIYLPVEKVGQDTRQGAIRLRKMIKAGHEALRERGLRTPQAEQLLSPVQALVEDALFWEHQEQGLALFASQDGLKIHQLIENCAEYVTISDRLMVLPLRPAAAARSTTALNRLMTRTSSWLRSSCASCPPTWPAA